MHTANTNSRPARNRRRGRLAAAAVATIIAGGIATSQATEAAPALPTRMSAIPTPCDGFADCIYTAVWYAFYR